MEKNGKLVQPRKLDNSQIGMICPAETPEGSSVGLVKNMALSTNVSIAMNSYHIRKVLEELGVVMYDDTYKSGNDNTEKSSINFLKNMGHSSNVYIMVNGDIMGYHNKPIELYKTLKHYKRSSIIHPMTSVVWNIQKSNIIISTEAGRMYRPLYIVDYDQQLKKSVLRIEKILKRKNMKWEDYIKDKNFDYFISPNEPYDEKNTDEESYLDEEGFIEYMDCDEINTAMIATFPTDLDEGIKGTALPPCYTHCEIHPSLMNGILGVNIPFSDHNQSPRNCYQCAMGKQALGIYASNFNKRIDTMGNILNYPQKSLVYTKLSKYTMAHKLPSGVNAIVAIMTHTGFNQEDSIMINQSALDRGLFTSTYYKALRDVCNKNHSTGEEEIFTNPNDKTEKKPYCYDKLDENGFVPKNTYVTGNDIIVGKVMPKKSNGEISYQDSSLTMKTNDDGYIDMNYNGINSEGYKFCKVRIRKNRKPEIGDKCASCSAQKGTIGMTYKHQDMPYTKDGIVPDIIMNPHAIPSRMTIAQLMECIMGKAGCHIGAFGDSTPYNDCTVEDIAKVLEMSGMERYGNEIMYNGRTGEQIRTEIFIGPT
jgi:DNA-directed RNA polymerase II subunit RPB2